VIAGIDAATSTSSIFTTKLTAALTAAIGLGPNTIVVNKVLFNTPPAASGGGGSSGGYGYVRRNLLADSINVNYQISATNMPATRLIAAAMASVSTGSLTMQLNNSGYTTAAASTNPTTTDVSPNIPTMSPTTAPRSSAQSLSSPLLLISSIAALSMFL
jgi:hypothetical protein